MRSDREFSCAWRGVVVQWVMLMVVYRCFSSLLVKALALSVSFTLASCQHGRHDGGHVACKAMRGILV